MKIRKVGPTKWVRKFTHTDSASALPKITFPAGSQTPTSTDSATKTSSKKTSKFAACCRTAWNVLVFPKLRSNVPVTVFASTCTPLAQVLSSRSEEHTSELQ